MRRIVWILFSLALFYSCGNQNSYGKLFKIEENQWSSDSDKTVVYQSTDTISLKKISLLISTTPSFKQKSLTFELTVTSPKGRVLKDTITLEDMAFNYVDVKNSTSKVYTIQRDVIKDLRFYEFGSYIFKTRPIADSKGVASFGFYIEQQ